MMYKNGFLISNERIEEKLPIQKDNIRTSTIDLYSSFIWRLHNDDLKDALNKLYELAYSNGLSDMDAMHSKIDKNY